MTNWKKTAENGIIGGGSALGGAMILGGAAGPVAGGFAADKVTDNGSHTYTKIGAGIAVFSLLGGGNSGGSGGGVM